MISTKLFIAGFILTQLIVVTAMADTSLNESNNFWIKINPVPQHYIGETINITGTTNLHENEKLQVKGIADQEYRYRLELGDISDQHPWYTLNYKPWWILKGECKIEGNTTIREFICPVNTSKKSPELHQIIVFSPRVMANSTLVIKNRWLKFNTFEQNVSVGDIFSVTGTTNAPEGARLVLDIFGGTSNWMNPAGYPCHHCVTLITDVVKSNLSNDIGTFSFIVNTSDLSPGENDIWLYESDEFWGDGFTSSSLLVNSQPLVITPIETLKIPELWFFRLCIIIVGVVCIHIFYRRKKEI